MRLSLMILTVVFSLSASLATQAKVAPKAETMTGKTIPKRPPINDDGPGGGGSR